jgi:hypothetical protein
MMSITSRAILPAWAPRVKANRIRRLYAGDALGMLDAGLLNEAGWGLVLRCRSFVEVMVLQARPA